VALVGERREDVSDPVQLHRPAGVQLENIGPGHQHIDLIYFARPIGPTGIADGLSEDRVGWYNPENCEEMSVERRGSRLVREGALHALTGAGCLKSYWTFYGSEQSRR
jgi:hypothetical protein